MSGWIQHASLASFSHGFGARGCEAPAGLVRAKQVHGRKVLRVTEARAGVIGEADALVCALPGVPIGIVTADCVPVLIATPSGAVAAVHAGWRGLAAGVLDAALEALAAIAPDATRAAAVIGPHIGASCYEVDAPVIRELEARFAGDLAAALRPTRPGHHTVELARLAECALVRSGLDAERVARIEGACTACDRERFPSYRRDGPRAGRLFHFITARGTPSLAGA